MSLSVPKSGAKNGPEDNRNRKRNRPALRERGPIRAPVVTAEGPELFLLLDDYEAGRLAPAQVALGAMPADATSDMRRVAEDVRLLMGLCLAVGEDRPLPYATTFAAERMGWGANCGRAGRAIRRLCDAGVIRYVESLPARGKRDGTKTYAPPLAVSAGAFEGEPVAVKGLDGVAVEPAREVEDQAAVGDAEPGPGVHRTAAPGDRADGRIDHEIDATDATGGSDPDVERAERIAARHEDLP